jgi:hypothetical protein
MEIHRQVGRLEGAVPVDDIAFGLDISEIRKVCLDGVEGLLLTDRVRSQGKILVNTRGGRRRARFSIAHEIGHFVMERHVLSSDDGFSCDRSDMQQRQSSTKDRMQEAEANQFAISLLAPPCLVAPYLQGAPDIKTVQALSDILDISLEAAMRLYVEHSDEALAAVWSQNGEIKYFAPGKRFPRLCRTSGDMISVQTPADRAIADGERGTTEMVEAVSCAWTDASNIELFEQTRVGKDGYALTLLWAKLPDVDGGTAGF